MVRPASLKRVLPKISQEMLAEMIGTTRSRVNFFMNKFRKHLTIVAVSDAYLRATMTKREEILERGNF